MIARITYNNISLLKEMVEYVLQIIGIEDLTYFKQHRLDLNNTKDTGHLAVLFDQSPIRKNYTIQILDIYKVDCSTCKGIQRIIGNGKHFNIFVKRFKLFNLEHEEMRFHIVSIIYRVYELMAISISQQYFKQKEHATMINNVLDNYIELFSYLDPNIPWDLLL